MKINTVCLVTLMFLILSNNLTSQINYPVQGIVKDVTNGDTLIGVTLLIKGTNKGTTTNAKGSFSIRLVPGDYTMVFSYTGYENKELPVSLNGDMFLSVALQQSLTNIDEVKITSQRKFFGNMEYGRDIPTIGSKTIELQNTNNASDILHASVAGVWATKTSGSPGDHEKIRIRGQNSFFSSAEPLYVVDGVPVPIVNLSSLGIADLNIHDIENVTILRDASATALYGFQGGNGVVLIDTKKGGENEINFSTKFGLQWFNNFYDLMNTKDLLNSLSLAKNNLNLNLVSYYPKMSDTIANNNWQKEIFRTGYTKEYQLSASGTIKTIKYYISGNYTDEAGILPNTNYKRYTFSSRISRVFLKKLAIDIGYRVSSQDNNNNQDTYLGNLLLINGITTSPCYKSTPDSLYFDSHGIPYRRTYSTYPSFRVKEPMQSIIDNNLNNLGIKSHIISSSARLELGDHLSINAMESLMLRYSNYYYNSYGTIVKSNEDVFLLNHQYNISYFNTFNKHNIDIVGAIRFYEDNLWWKVDTMQGELNSYSYLRNSMAAYGQKWVCNTLSGIICC